MEELSYTVENATLARILGRDNFSTAQSAVLELIKNAYDSGATECSVVVSDKIVVKDNGNGMSVSDFHNKWMHVGSSTKVDDITVSVDGKSRVVTGSMGLGRFALARLGKEVDVYSKVSGQSRVCYWHTEWESAFLDEDKESERFPDSGTEIVISGLRDDWTRRSVNKLQQVIERSWCGSDMRIRLTWNGKDIQISSVCSKAESGRNFTTSIELHFDSTVCQLRYSILSDEFNANARRKISNKDISKEVGVIDVYDELAVKLSEDGEKEALRLNLEKLGNFEAKLYFGISRSLKNNAVSQYYKHESLEKSDIGVAVYRNAFCVASLDGRTDWLGLDRRARHSPAAATHPTGAWRVRRNQLFGFVYLDRQNNSLIKDLANRQGVEENAQFECLRSIITEGIATFERYRQSIIRRLCESDPVESTKEAKWASLLSDFVKTPMGVKQLSDAEVKELSEAAGWSLDSRSRLLREANDLKYDKQILNYFATQGLRALTAAHELKTDEQAIREASKNVREALKDIGLWEELQKEEYTSTIATNVPQLLNRFDESTESIQSYMNALLAGAEKNRFKVSWVNVNDALKNIAEQWEKEYGAIQIELQVEEQINLYVSLDTFDTIFSNLILNTIQQNKGSSKKTHIIIKCKSEENDSAQFEYQDDGIGLVEPYKSHPDRIMEVHETSRENGHGLGMWIISNEIQIYDGRVEKIGSESGFTFQFVLKGKEIQVAR